MEDLPATSLTAGWAERLPWAFVAGVALYMSTPYELSWDFLFFVVGSLCLGGILIWKFRSLSMAALTLAVLLFALGAGWGMWSAHSADHKVLRYPVWSEISGEVESVVLRNKGYRVVLGDVRIHGDRRDIQLVKIRIYMPGRYPAPVPGDVIRVKGSLSPPPEPVHPYAYNMPRQAWFQKLAAVGFTNSRWTLIRKANETSLTQSIAAWRQNIRDEILQTLGKDNPTANIVVALIVGERGGIPKPIVESYRGAGMAHMLAISGLHMSLLAGLAYVLIRRGLLLFPSIALNYPIKKWAAFAALLMTALYLILSGASVPTQRAFMMTAIALCAVMWERSPISLRLVGVAAFVVILISPEAVTGASFQMSFAAVLALISVYQGSGQGRWFRNHNPVLRYILLYVVGVVFTTLIASAATAPIAMYHFGRVATYAIGANTVALPVLGLWVMPWALLAMILMPFGLSGFALHRMADGVEWLNAVAAKVVSWPHSVFDVPQMPQIGFIFCVAGGLWLALKSGKIRVLGAISVVIGLISPWWTPLPDILIANHGAVVAVQQDHGYGMVSLGRDKFIRSVWQSSTTETIHKEQGWNCDAMGCVGQSAHGWLVARSDHPAGLQNDCAAAAVVIARYPVSFEQRQDCGQTVVFDQRDLWRLGSMTLWLDPNGKLKAKDSLSNHQAKRLWRP